MVWEQIRCCGNPIFLDPIGDRFPRAFHDPDQIATEKFTIDGEIEARQFFGFSGELQVNLDCPDPVQFKRQLLTDKFAVVPGCCFRSTLSMMDSVFVEPIFQLTLCRTAVPVS